MKMKSRGLHIGFDRWMCFADRVRLIGNEVRRLQPFTMPYRKADGSVVSEADLYAERAIIECAKELFPDILIISEEKDGEEKNIPRSGYVLILDPLDGSKWFTEQRSEWCIAIALLLDGVPIAAIIAQPVLDRYIAGMEGLGLLVLGGTVIKWQKFERKRIAFPKIGVAHSSDEETFEKTKASTNAIEQVFGTYENQPTVHCILDVGIGDSIFCYVCGRSKAWDVATGHLLMSMLGFVMRHRSGKPVSFAAINMGTFEDPIICAENKEVYERVRRVTLLR